MSKFYCANPVRVGRIEEQHNLGCPRSLRFYDLGGVKVGGVTIHRVDDQKEALLEIRTEKQSLREEGGREKPGPRMLDR